jgi:AraC-like DNA-binding protein
MTTQRAFYFNVEGPLHTPAPPGTIRAGYYFQGFKRLVQGHGGDYRRILDRYGIDPLAVEDPDHPVSCIASNDMLEYCSQHLKDDVFGLHLASCQDTEAYGLTSALARSAPTFGQAVRSLVEYLPILHFPGAALEFVVGNETAEFRWRPYANFGYDEQANYHALMLAARCFQALAGRNFRPSYVSSMTDNPRSEVQTAVEKEFGCKFFQNSTNNSIGFPIEFLEKPLRTSNKILFKLISSYLDEARRETRPTVVDQAEAYVRGALPSGACSIVRCARTLGISARTLQRDLTDAGIKFSDIVEDQRINAAKRALLETDSDLDEIAINLGYSEQSSFGRAFKRWTGLTPRAFQLENRRALQIRP